MVFNSVKKFSDFQQGYAGQPGDASDGAKATYAIELSSSQEYTAGKVLLLGTDPEKQVRPTVNGDELDYHNFAGFGVLNLKKEDAYGSDLQYSNGDWVEVLKEGTMYVEAGGTVTAGEAVVVQVNGGALTSAHATGSLSSGQSFVPMARWEQSATSGNVAKISLGRSLAHREISGSL